MWFVFVRRFIGASWLQKCPLEPAFGRGFERRVDLIDTGRVDKSTVRS